MDGKRLLHQNVWKCHLMKSAWNQLAIGMNSSVGAWAPVVELGHQRLRWQVTAVHRWQSPTENHTSVSQIDHTWWISLGVFFRNCSWPFTIFVSAWPNGAHVSSDLRGSDRAVMVRWPKNPWAYGTNVIGNTMAYHGPKSWLHKCVYIYIYTYITLHYMTLHYTTLYYIRLQNIT